MKPFEEELRKLDPSQQVGREQHWHALVEALDDDLQPRVERIGW